MIIVKEWKEVEPEEMLEGVKIRWLIGKELNPPNFYLRLFEVEPGKATPYHQHDWEHESFILEGKGAIKNPEGELQHFEPGYFIYIPPNVKHQFVNLGDTVLKFICIIPKKG